jgi:hypothetical protein
LAAWYGVTERLQEYNRLKSRARAKIFFIVFILRLLNNDFRVDKIAIIQTNFPANLRELFPDWE